MDSSDSDVVEIVEIRKSSGGGSGNNNNKAKRRRNRKPTGPPPRLAWGAAGVASSNGGSGGGAAGAGSLGGIGSSKFRSGRIGSSGSGAAAGNARKSIADDDDDDDGLWADDDDDLGLIPASSSASSSRAAAPAAGSTGSSRRTKKAKKNTSSKSHPASSLSLSSSLMWVDKYAPTNAADLCVAPKRVKEIREWMAQTHSPPLPPPSLSGDNDGQQQLDLLGFGTQQQEAIPRLLVLVGSPGVGKSTAIHVLASELGWTVHQWNDAQQDTAPYDHGGGGYNGRDAALSVRWQSQLSSFEEFLASAGSGFSPLEFDGGGGGGSGGLALSTSSGRKSLAEGGKRKSSSAASAARNNSTGSNGSIILIEDIPNLYNSEAEMKFRNIMSQHIYRSKTPTVLIFSDVCEGKHRPSDLERLIDPSVLYSTLANICQIHGVAKPKIKKCLQIIVKAERLKISDTLYEELHSSSKGDMRHAIMALQFQFASAGGGKINGNDVRGQYSDRDRDTKLSTFHALGKLLYAKRKKMGYGGESMMTARATWNSILPSHLHDSRPPLDFVPEDVMNKSDIEHSGAVSFLSYHSPEFFIDEMELSTAFDHFSDAALFLDRTYSVNRDRSDTIFPLEYVSSIAGRAVANANKNPAPNRFRQLNAPKVFEVMQKKRRNDVSMLQLCKRLSCGSDVLSLSANIGSTNNFVVDTLPYMRNIVPQEVDSALANLYSYARPLDQGSARFQYDTGSILRRHIKEQSELLADDDIADDDDSIGEQHVESMRSEENGDSMNTDNIERKMSALPSKSVKFSNSSAQQREVIILD